MKKYSAMEAFLKNLLIIMDDKGITKSALCHQCGMSRAGLDRILSGEERVTIDRAERIAGAVGSTLQEMFSMEFEKISV